MVWSDEKKPSYATKLKCKCLYPFYDQRNKERNVFTFGMDTTIASDVKRWYVFRKAATHQSTSADPCSKSHSSNDATAEAAKATAANSMQSKPIRRYVERASEFALVRMLSANIPTRNCNLSLMMLLAQRRASQRRMWDCLLFMTYFFV